MLVKSYTRKRRTAQVGAVVFLGLLLAVGAGFCVLMSSSSERIHHYGVDVAVQADGTALVRETIDYDFGSNDKHGIFRFFPGYEFPAQASEGSQVVSDVRVRAASAPSEFEAGGAQAEIKVGDPDVEVSGRHRYVLEYRITGAVSGDKVSFDAIGTDWQVPVDRADIRLTAPYRLGDAACFRGAVGSTEGCGPVETSGGTLAVHVDGLDEGEGVTVDATNRGGSARSALPAAVDLTGGDDGRSYWTTVWVVVGWGALAFTVGALVTALWSRRAGQDRAWAGGGVDAVFGGPGMASARISDREAERQVTMQFEPPRDLSPAHGGVLLFEEVKNNHKVAWLTQQAVAGFIGFEQGGKLLRRTDDEARWAEAPLPLKQMFAKRTTVPLGTYDKKFATAISTVGKELTTWRTQSKMWDHAAEKRNLRISRWSARLGWLATIVALVLVWVLRDVALYAMAAATALLAGAGTTASLSKDELSVRTPAGFAGRQLVEGFRRFFAASEGRHAREAAERGELRLYSAWAVALNELDAWNKAMTAATLPPDTAGVSDTTNLLFVSSAMSTTTTPPTPSGGSSGDSGSSYSGGGFSGGGDVGGGGGGGGGGSW